MTETTATATWTQHHEFEDIRYETTDDGIAKITINRPEVHNAFARRHLLKCQKRWLSRARTNQLVSSSSLVKAHKRFAPEATNEFVGTADIRRMLALQEGSM